MQRQITQHQLLIGTFNCSHALSIPHLNNLPNIMMQIETRLLESYIASTKAIQRHPQSIKQSVYVSSVVFRN